LIDGQSLLISKDRQNAGGGGGFARIHGVSLHYKSIKLTDMYLLCAQESITL